MNPKSVFTGVLFIYRNVNQRLYQTGFMLLVYTLKAMFMNKANIHM